MFPICHALFFISTCEARMRGFGRYRPTDSDASVDGEPQSGSPSTCSICARFRRAILSQFCRSHWPCVFCANATRWDHETRRHSSFTLPVLLHIVSWLQTSVLVPWYVQHKFDRSFFGEIRALLVVNFILCAGVSFIQTSLWSTRTQLLLFCLSTFVHGNILH